MCLIPVEIPRNSLVVINDEMYVARYITQQEINEIVTSTSNREFIAEGMYLLSGYTGGPIMDIKSYSSMRTYRLDMFDYKKTLKVDIIAIDISKYLNVVEKQIADLLTFYSASDENTPEERVVYTQQLKERLIGL